VALAVAFRSSSAKEEKELGCDLFLVKDIKYEIYYIVLCRIMLSPKRRSSLVCVRVVKETLQRLCDIFRQFLPISTGFPAVIEINAWSVRFTDKI